MDKTEINDNGKKRKQTIMKEREIDKNVKIIIMGKKERE